MKSFSSYLGGVKLILSCEIPLLSANYEWESRSDINSYAEDV